MKKNYRHDILEFLETSLGTKIWVSDDNKTAYIKIGKSPAILIHDSDDPIREAINYLLDL